MKAQQASNIFRLWQHFTELRMAIFGTQLKTEMKNIYLNNNTYL